MLAAGLGTRLRPLTSNTPKCLVPINGVPLMQIWLERLSAAGIGPFLVNTHYLQDQVAKFVAQSAFKSQVQLVEEVTLLGTAGTLLANREFFSNEDGMLLHADNYCLANFPRFIAAHEDRSKNCLMTMMTFTSDRPQQCGVVELDSSGVVVDFHEKVNNPPSSIANAAAYILSAEMIRELNGVTDFSTEVIRQYLGKIQSYHIRETLIDVGTLESYHQACAVALKQNKELEGMK